MPSGYTAGVQDGTITTFHDYALNCARAFGALIMMRDDSPNAPIPDSFEPDSYYAKALDEREAEYARLKTLTDKQIADECEADFRQKMVYWQKSEEKRAIGLKRYVDMLAAVEAWNPPTREHVGLKEFMAKQLRESIDFDYGNSSPAPQRITAAEWYDEAVTQAANAVAYSAKSLAEERKRCAERTEWIRELRRSLI